MLNRQGLYGDFFSFYLCDLILKLNGKGDNRFTSRSPGRTPEVHAAMKTFAERNPIVVGLLGVAVTLGVVLAALNYGKLPFVNSNREYSAYFAEAGGLLTGAAVQVSGFQGGRGHRHRTRRPPRAGHLLGRQGHPPRRSHRGGDKDQEHPRSQDPGTDPAR